MGKLGNRFVFCVRIQVKMENVYKIFNVDKIRFGPLNNRSVFVHKIPMNMREFVENVQKGQK